MVDLVLSGLAGVLRRFDPPILAAADGCRNPEPGIRNPESETRNPMHRPCPAPRRSVSRRAGNSASTAAGEISLARRAALARRGRRRT